MKYFAQYRHDIYDKSFGEEPLSKYIPRVFDFEIYADVVNEAEIARHSIEEILPFSKAFLIKFKLIESNLAAAKDISSVVKDYCLSLGNSGN